MADNPVHDVPPTDAELLAWLRTAVDHDGTLRVRRLAVTDEMGQECIILQRDRLRAEVAVSLPESPGGSAGIALYAQAGEASDGAVDPTIGAVIVVGGNEAASVNVVPDRWGGWKLHASAEGPTAVSLRRPRSS